MINDSREFDAIKMFQSSRSLLPCDAIVYECDTNPIDTTFQFVTGFCELCQFISLYLLFVFLCSYKNGWMVDFGFPDG